MVTKSKSPARSGQRTPAELTGLFNAISRSQAVIEFSLDGTILTANENFLRTLGYTLNEIQGRHHSMFVESGHRDTEEYRNFWENLRNGEYNAGEYRRIGKGGREIWIQATYNPIFDARGGRPVKVVKFATDITQQKLEARMNAAFKGALDNVTTNVMVADTQNNIIYMNNTVRAMMSEAQSDIRKDLPGFDVNRLIGTNIDTFHKNPAHQRGLLAGLSKTFSSELKIGGRTMRITASPMRDEAGERIGTVVEWADRTQEVAIEAEVQGIVSGITDGALEKRIDLAAKSGFFEALSKGINTLVENVQDVVEEVQKLVTTANSGDLTQRLSLEGRSGLFHRIGAGINQLTDNMADIVTKVQSAASEVSRGADEISQGNTNLSQRTEEQASSLEETASSMEEMTSTVRQNADNAGQANQLAVAARDQAEKGGAVVARAVKAMTEINESSKKISDIIGVIDEIAFQTNLLALNAAVEAARAGEQGRGFAVVASEVRNLAGRSATAAKEIKELIQDSVRRVEEGSSLVTQSGATLENIIGAVKKVSDIVAEIAAASQEQSTGIEQVNKAVMQLDELTQQNAALVEEASAASQAMADQARSLNDVMARYRVSDEDNSPVAAAPKQAKQELAQRPRVASVADRRAQSRPWSERPRAGKPTRTSAASEPAHPARATGTDDADWKEF
jgi:methyl-accepting chemotaxis protein